MARNDPPVLRSKPLSRIVSGDNKSVAVRRGAVVFRQSDRADSVFYVEAGRVKLAIKSTQGREAVVGLLGPGDFFGEGCLILQRRRLATATAMTPCQLVCIARGQMIRTLRRDRSFGEFFMRHLLTRKIRVEEDLVDQLFNSSEKRLARTLLLLASFANDGGPEPITAPVSQEILAGIIGTTRSRVSPFMNKFRERGYIEYKGRTCDPSSPLRVNRSLASVLLRE